MQLPRYTAPRSADEAVALLSAESGVNVLAGGSDLLVQCRAGVRKPRGVVDIKRIPGAIGIEVESASIRIGAATPCAQLTAHPEICRRWPGLVEAAGIIGSAQVQGRASLGGNLCNASPAADSVPAMIVDRAEAIVAGPAGQRRVAVENVCTAPGQTSLASGEFVLAFELPFPAERTADAYLRFIPRTEMDIAVVGAGVSVSLDKDGACCAARVAIGAVAPTVLLVEAAAKALLGSRFEDAAVAAFVDAVRAAARPISDKRGSAEFRRHVVGVIARRALMNAVARARAL